MNDKLIINRVSILRKGLEPKTYLLPSITDILTDGSIKKNHIDWLSIKLYLDGLYESKSSHDADINNINSRLITLSIDNEGNLEYSGYKFLNVTNYNPNSAEGLANRVTALEGNADTLLGNINTINNTLLSLPSTYASKTHTHAFSELTGISEENGYLNIGDDENKFIEILSSKLIELNALATEGGNVYITPKVRNGEKAILIAEPNENKKFVKWTYNNLDISTNPIHILNNPLSGAAYIGVFTEAGSDEPIQPTQYTLTINQPNHGSIIATANGVNLSYGTTSLTLGTLVHLEAGASTGYKFSGWTGVPTGKENLATVDFAINEDISISANFTALQYIITVSAATDTSDNIIGTGTYPTIKVGGIVQNNPATVNYNTSVTLETAASIGNYDFDHWSDNNNTNRIRTLSITSNLTTHPIYNRPTYQVTFGVNNSALGTITAVYKGTNQAVSSGSSIAKGSHLTFTATPSSGYELTSWSGIPSGSTYDDVVVNSVLNISATFSEITPEHVQITVEFGERINGEWTRFNPSVRVMLDNQLLLGNPYYVSDLVYLDGRHLTVDGYQFMQWEDSDHEVIENEELHKGANEGTHYFGTFAKEIELRVETNNEDGGTVSGLGTYVDGTIVNISATANEGYHFVKWSDNNTLNPRTITVNNNTTTYTAIFEINTYTVSASVNPAGSGTVTVGGTANSKSISHGSTTTLVATSSSGYEFVNWTLNGTQVANTVSYTTPVITAAASYIAHFAEVVPINNTIYYFASENDDYSPTGKTVKTLGDNNTTEQLNNVDTLVFLVPTTITITKIEDAQMGTDFFNKFQTHAVTYNSKEYTAYYYTDPDAYINGQFIVRL